MLICTILGNPKHILLDTPYIKFYSNMKENVGVTSKIHLHA